MYLQLNSSGDLPNGIPEFFSLYGVDRLPAFWQPFHSPWFTLVAIWLVPAVLAAVLGNLVFRNRIKGVYFSILTQAALLVFFNFFNGQQKLINGTNGLKTDVTELFGQMVGSSEMQRGFFLGHRCDGDPGLAVGALGGARSIWRCVDCYSR
jgi:urea transport system permease protein